MITAETALHLANEANSVNGILQQINSMITEAAKGGNKSIYYNDRNFILDKEIKKKVVAQLKNIGYDVITERGTRTLFISWREI